MLVGAVRLGAVVRILYLPAAADAVAGRRAPNRGYRALPSEKGKQEEQSPKLPVLHRRRVADIRLAAAMHFLYKQRDCFCAVVNSKGEL